MFTWENILNVLIRDDFDKPCYVPAGLFDLEIQPLPSGWKFGLFSGIRASGEGLWTDPYGAAWGYAEFVDDPHHGIGLVEGDPAALAIFAERRAEAERA
ncbi:hypothetical protein F1D05_36890 [Kribbella qitaiheensis]|uniref:Uncharacterized protein n=1 Tax=Kribbella qitaiheensis TaxID=1544730 RepID=A0A7G6X898_9ACTN|nr:hypothetical protein [Kribbella qitaiheensis]QNE22463.1 hypothetical protein F1D05_36890 [Kribbella qitaiheensis]